MLLSIFRKTGEF